MPGQDDGAIHLNHYLTYIGGFWDIKQFYAVTVSLHPTEHKLLTEKGLCPFKYLRFKLESLGYKGCIVSEYTKKKVPHVHGILTIPSFDLLMKITTKSGKFKYFMDTRMEVSNVIKPLTTKQSINGWSDYMLKCIPSLNVIEWMEKYQAQATSEY